MKTQPTGSVGPTRLAIDMIVLLVVGSLSTLAQESANYVMDRVTLSSVALETSSANYGLSVTLGQEGPVGSVSACNAGRFHSTGFWSIVGDAPVPIVLSARRDPGNPSSVELSWSGSFTLFEVFSSDVAASVVNPGNSLVTTSLCAVSDVPPPAQVIYYLVLPAGD